MPQKELCYWMAYFKIKNKEDEEKYGKQKSNSENTPTKKKDGIVEVSEEEQRQRDLGWVGILMAASAKK